jgi:hypothetical protein
MNLLNRYESPIIRHLAATYMQKSMMSAVTQCEMYHVNLILYQSKLNILLYFMYFVI